MQLLKDGLSVFLLVQSLHVAFVSVVIGAVVPWGATFKQEERKAEGKMYMPVEPGPFSQEDNLSTSSTLF